MRKIKSVFKRDYITKLATDEVTSGCEWVILGEGYPTVKIDGTCCLIKENILYKRYSRVLKKGIKAKLLKNQYKLSLLDYTDAPKGWIACEPKFDPITGHFPGWLQVDKDNPSDKYHIEAFNNLEDREDGTYELVGPKVQGNPYKLNEHILVKHGIEVRECPRTYHEMKDFFHDYYVEGIVFYHDDGRMAKIKRRDFGFKWPVRRM